MLAYGDEPWLEKCVRAVLRSRNVDVEVVLVDNGCSTDAVSRLRSVSRIVHTGDGVNLGFAAGCNLGASVASGDYLALVNGDLLVDQDALARLVEALNDRSIGIAAGSVRLADDPDLLNTAGNEIHFLGFSWTGGFGERAAEVARARDVAGAMGALLLLRRDTWNLLRGFEERYFAFHEDADLSWRCWQQGLRVHYLPDAMGIHRYEFSRIPMKFYLAERNRLIFVLTNWEARTILLLAPVFLVMEVAVAVAALSGGWLQQKVAGWRWLLRHRSWLRERRTRVLRERARSDRDLAYLLATRLQAGNYPLSPALRPLDFLLSCYWSIVRRVLAP